MPGNFPRDPQSCRLGSPSKQDAEWQRSESKRHPHSHFLEEELKGRMNVCRRGGLIAFPSYVEGEKNVAQPQ